MTSARQLMSPGDVCDEKGYRFECKRSQSSEKTMGALAYSSEMAAMQYFHDYLKNV